MATTMTTATNVAASSLIASAASHFVSTTTASPSQIAAYLAEEGDTAQITKTAWAFIAVSSVVYLCFVLSRFPRVILPADERHRYANVTRKNKGFEFDSAA